MEFNRGDIITLKFLIPGTEEYKEHPGVIVSGPDLYRHDACYICVMMTHSTKIDPYTFELKQYMFAKKNQYHTCQLRTHLITYITPSDILHPKPFNRMKTKYVDLLADHVRFNAIGM